MSAKESRNGSDADTIPEGGILAALPRTRPQRASARREAARASTATEAKPANARATRVVSAKTRASIKSTTPKRPAAPKRPATPTKPTTVRKRSPKLIAKPPEPPAPKQGYEPEEEVELGATVHPPSSAELVESVADIVSELAGSSFAAGGRLLKDALSLLRRP